VLHSFPCEQAAAQRVVKARLITIPFSHFCEKSRFALDLSPLAYTEEAHAPGFHRPALKGLVEDASKNSVPLLILEQQSSDNKTVPPVKLQCSTRIMQYLHTAYPTELGHWFPTDEKECEEALHLINNDLEKLGVHARRWAYSYLLTDAEICKRVWSSNVPFFERAAIPLAFNTIRSAIVKGYKATPEKNLESLEICQKTFDSLDERLSDGRRYILGGDKISAVDITFAALSYPLLAPPEFDSIAFKFEDYPAEMKAVTERLRQTAAGKHALRLYHEERYSDQSNGTAVHVKQDQSGGCTIM
jgi:glutathione S-transferase